MDRGIYPKYVIFKHPKFEPKYLEAKAVTIASPQVTEELLALVDDFCFVLKPINDKHARIAMAAYAESVKEEKPQLARDLLEILSDF